MLNLAYKQALAEGDGSFRILVVCTRCGMLLGFFITIQVRYSYFFNFMQRK